MNVQKFICSAVALLFSQPVLATDPSAMLVQRHVQPDPEAVIAYWTIERMKSAEARAGADDCIVEEGAEDACGFRPIADATANLASRINGVLFFEDSDGQNHHCSASVIASRSRDLILTASTCLRQGVSPADWKRNFMFVPAYDGQSAPAERTPLGRWPIAVAYAQSERHGSANPGIGAAKTYPRMDANGDLEFLEDVVGPGAVPAPGNDSLGSFIPGPAIAYPGSQSYGGTRSGRQYRCDVLSVEEGGPIDQRRTGFAVQPCRLAAGSEGAPLYTALKSSIPELAGIAIAGNRFARLTLPAVLPLLEAASLDEE